MLHTTHRLPASIALVSLLTSSTLFAGILALPSATDVLVDSIHAEGATTHTATVLWYSGQVGEDVYAASIDVNDLTITGPGGPLTITGVVKNPPNDATNITATYTFNAPGGTWDSSDNGTYTIDIAGTQVANSTNGSPQQWNDPVTTAASFDVGILSDLLLHWDIEEGSGTFTKELISGVSSVAELIEGPTWTGGLAPNSTQALNFTDTNPGSYLEAGTLQTDDQYVASASSTDFRLLNSAWTVAAWIEIPAGPQSSSDRCIITTETSGVSNWWLFFVRNTNGLVNNLGFDFQSTRHDSGIGVPTDKPVLVVISAASSGEGFGPGMHSRFSMWDGSKWESVETNRFSNIRLDRMEIGAFNSGTREFRGDIDSVQIFESALDAEELTALALSNEIGGDLGGSVSTSTTLTNSNSVDFTVQFSESVNGVDPADFNITTNGTLTLGPASVSGLPGTSIYTLSVPVTGNGDLNVDLILGSGIQTLDGDPLAVQAGSAIVTIDQNSPTLSSITLQGSNPTPAKDIHFTFAFDEKVTGFDDASDLHIVHGPGTSHGSVNISGSGQSYTVTLLDVTGDGSFTVSLSPLANVVDLAGNTHGSALISDPVNHVIDITPPTVISITPDLPNPIEGGSVLFSVLFSEEVFYDTGEDDPLVIDPTNFEFNWVSSPSPGDGSATNFGVRVSVKVEDGFSSGSLLASVPLSSSITDLAGNALVGPAPSTNSIIFSADAYQLWANSYSLTPELNYDANDDADNDGRINGIEFLRGDNPAVANEPSKQRLHVATVEGETFGALTISAPDDAIYESESIGRMYLGYCDSYSLCMYEEINPSADLESFPDGSTILLEDSSIATPVGMPALPTGWSYRHFRFTQNTDELPKAFIIVETDED